MNHVETINYTSLPCEMFSYLPTTPPKSSDDDEEPVAKRTCETTCEPVYQQTSTSTVFDKSQSPRITSSTEIYLVKRLHSSAGLKCENLGSGSTGSMGNVVSNAVSKRNERERNRVKLVNMGFHTLRQHIPNGSKGKMSKVETLRSAVEYIRALQSVLNDESPSSLSEGPSLASFMCLKNLENCISYQ